MASALVDPKSVPESLRERVRASKEAQYEYAQNRYLNSLTTDALFVGEPIKIPGGGMYEMYVVFTLNTQAETLTLIRNSLIFTGFALIFLIGLITWLVVRQVVRPVRDAARIANQFTDGDFSQRMQVGSQDEMASLAHSYNEMAQSIEQQISRLENLSRVQQRFVSDVSHELRTPLTAIRGFAELHRQGAITGEENTRELVGRIESESKRMSALVEDLLTLARLDQARAIAHDAVDIKQLIEEAVQAVKASAPNANISMDIPTEEATPTTEIATTGETPTDNTPSIDSSTDGNTTTTTDTTQNPA